MLSGLLNQTITHYPRSGYDKTGRPTTSTGTTLKARVQKQNKTRLLPNNAVVNILASVYVEPTTILVDDRIDYGTDKYKVLSRSEAIGERGEINHLKLELIKWE